MKDVVLIGSPIQQRRQEFGRIAGGTEGDRANEPVAARHQWISAGIEQDIDHLVMTVVLGRCLLVLHRAVKGAVVVAPPTWISRSDRRHAQAEELQRPLVRT